MFSTRPVPGFSCSFVIFYRVGVFTINSAHIFSGNITYFEQCLESMRTIYGKYTLQPISHTYIYDYTEEVQ